jgi:Holliday junction resolvase RusA-like endonuclease
MPSSPASFTFRVLGTPVPQGSVKAYSSRQIVANNEHALGSWRSDVASAAQRAKPGDWDINAAISLRCEFVFPRPLSHYGTGKNSTKLKPSAPRYHVKTPDVDKLVRGVADSIGDAVARVLLNNDSQIVSIYAAKRYSTDDFLGAIITVTALS